MIQFSQFQKIFLSEFSRSLEIILMVRESMWFLLLDYRIFCENNQKLPN